jgi:hypothetical protein
LAAACAYRSPIVSSRRADVGAHDRQQVLVHLPAARELEQRQPQAFLEHVRRLGRQQPPADVRRVAGGDEEREQPSSRNTGVATVMSLTCPAVIHGSLVSRTSPGERLAREGVDEVPHAGRHRVDVAGRAAARLADHVPAVSKTPHARSSDSRTIVQNAVRTSVACCSSSDRGAGARAMPT